MNILSSKSPSDHRHTASAKISAKESGGITEAISLCTLDIFTLVSLPMSHFRHISRVRIYLCSGKDRRPIRVMNAPMHSRNVDNLAVYIGHLNTRLIEFRTSDMFRSVCIDPPVRIIAQ